MGRSVMDYKAFVSSTFLDLKDHRAHVIRELRKAGFFVDPMEEWTSAAQEPKLLSTNRLDDDALWKTEWAERGTDEQLRQ